MSTGNYTVPPDAQHGPGSPYGYYPTASVCITFIVLFGLSAFLHTVEAIIWRTWFMLPTMVMGCIGECIGWAGRYWSSQNPRLMDPFLMQISCTIISPTFMSAANFTILGLIIKRLGTQYSWLTPGWCECACRRCVSLRSCRERRPHCFRLA